MTDFSYFCNMVRPDFLKKGDTILLLSPAGKIKAENVLPTAELLKSWGFVVKIAAHSFGEHYRFAGTEEQRLQDMQAALDDKNIKAILCNRGGYGSIQILNKLNFQKFLQHPKWLIGFSDITIFHSYFNRILRCETLHAPMPVNLSENDVPKETMENFRKALFGESLQYEILPNSLNIIGSAQGELIGGNLATFANLLSTPFSYEFNNKILFIEDIGEPIHKIDQMLWALKLSGKLAQLKGLIVGSFTDIDDNPTFGKNTYEIIQNFVKPYNFPVVFDFPAGHIPQNYPLYIGRKVDINSSKAKASLTFL